MRYMSVWKDGRSLRLHTIDYFVKSQVNEWIQKYHANPRSDLLAVFDLNYGFTIHSKSITLQKKALIFNRAPKSIIGVVP